MAVRSISTTYWGRVGMNLIYHHLIIVLSFTSNVNMMWLTSTLFEKQYTDVVLTQNNSYHNKTSFRVNIMWNGS